MNPACQHSVFQALPKDLRQHLRQYGVGVSHNGIHQRVTNWSDPDFLLRA